MLKYILNTNFYADYTCVKCGNDYISRVYKPKAIGLGYTVRNVKSGIVNKN